MDTDKGDMKHLTILALLMTICGCASTRGYEQRLNKWVGKKSDFLIMDWGAPNQSYQLESGAKVLTYVKQSGSSGYVAPSGHAIAETNYCKTNFMVSDENVVESWKWEGNTCKAKVDKPSKCRWLWPFDEFVWSECKV